MDICEIAAECSKQTIITGHALPDFDSVASAYIMKQALRYCGVNTEIIFSDKPDKYNAAMLEKYCPDAVYTVGEAPDNADLILCDCHKSPFKSRCNIIACIDHHPTGEMPPCDLYINKTASSAARLVLKLFEKSGAIISREIESAAVASVYLDTLSLRNSKFQTEDKEWISNTARKYGFNLSELERDGLCLTDLTSETGILATDGFKEYSVGSYKIASSYITAVSLPEEKKKSIENECARKRIASGYDLWILIIYDPVNLTTRQINIGEKCDEALYDGLLSRGNDIIPEAEKRFMQLHK